MKAEKVLFITQEVAPYVEDGIMSQEGLDFPQYLTDNGRSVRTFMPRWGSINDRRHQLHEVQRLSGMNVIIDDSDHTLVIKVASIPQTRAQVYFIDNDDYFHKREMLLDEAGEPYEDNAERAIFFARGVLETVKKFRWIPDIIHCNGWATLFTPLYVRTAYRDDPPFATPRIVFSLYDDVPEALPGLELAKLVRYRSLNERVLRNAGFSLKGNVALRQILLTYCDAFIEARPGVAPELLKAAREKGKPVLEYREDLSYADKADFFESLIND